MRIAISCLLLAALSACKTSPHYKKADYAEIATYLAPSCEKPSVRFRELRDEKANDVNLKRKPLRVRPGVYVIGLSCGTNFNSDLNACTAPEGDVTEHDVPAYNLVINPRVRYLFICLQVNGEWTYQMVKSNL